MLEFFGQSLEQLPGWSSLIHPNDRERVVNLWRRSIETGQPYDVEHRARRADGVFRWLHSRGQLLRDAEGRVVRWCIMLTDVDDRKRAEESLRASELNFRVIIDSIPGLVHTLAATGELEFVNQQNLDYFGKTLDELRGWASSDVFHPDDVPRADYAFLVPFCAYARTEHFL
jgi:PAS domain S-box-containing protein